MIPEGYPPDSERTLQDIMLQEISSNGSAIEGEIFSMESLFPNDIQMSQNYPYLAFKASADPDTMYLHQAMRDPDKEQFITAMHEEVRSQMGNGNFSIVKRSKVPKGETILPAVWQMKRKRDIKTRKVKK